MRADQWIGIYRRFWTGRLDTLPLITHRFHGCEHMEEALLLMKNKPRDLIKPGVILD